MRDVLRVRIEMAHSESFDPYHFGPIVDKRRHRSRKTTTTASYPCQTATPAF
jgi:hypothetical protein